jgi:hypothetical protein
MSLLREYIRELLTEAAMGPADLPDDAYVTIRGKGTRTKVYYAFEDGSRRDDAGAPWGFVHVAHITTNCLGANEVIGSSAAHGWGPLLYDIAMEVSGDQGLMADRESLSDDAYNVWQVYMSRGDVQKKQLDTLDNELTPDEADNCGTDTARDHDDAFDDYRSDMKKKALANSPVMKVYTKGQTTIGELESMGRLIRK